MSVEEIFFIDENGDERECTIATDACIDLSTCADQGTDLWAWLKEEIERRLKTAGVSFEHLCFADDRGN